MVPKKLRTWFVVHFVVDMLFAVPLLLFPVQLLEFLQWGTVDPLSARLVGAALFGIGIESYLGRNESARNYNSMLRLKLLWSSAAVFGIGLSIIQGAPVLAWLFLAIFVGFFCLWAYYKAQIQKRLKS